MVVSFSDQARIEQAFTDNRERLRRAVREIGPTNQSTSLDEALRICLRQARRRPAPTTTRPRPPRRRCRSCSSPPTAASQRRPTSRRKDSAPRSSPSAGRVEQSRRARVRRRATRGGGSPTPRRPWRRCATSPAEPGTVDVELRIGDRLVDARRIALEAGQQKDILFTLPTPPTASGNCDLPHGDELPVDDIAWAVLAPPRKTHGLVVTPGNRYLEAALATDEAQRWTKATVRSSPRFSKTADYQALVEAGSWDWIFDRCRPSDEPDLLDALSRLRCRRATVGAAPPKIDLPQVIDVARTHPLMQNVSLGEVLIAEAMPPIGPSGTQMLIDSDRGTLAVVAPRGAYEDVVLGFSMASADGTPLTNWPLVDGAGFEQFVLNVVQYFGRDRERRCRDERSAPARRFAFASSARRAKLASSRPTARATSLKRSRSGDFAFYDAAQVGPYRICSRRQDTVRRFCRQLVRRRGIANRLRGEHPTLKIGRGRNRRKIRQWETTRLEGWKPFLLIMLALLLVEWYIYGSAGRTLPNVVSSRPVFAGGVNRGDRSESVV